MVNEELHVISIGILCLRTLQVHTFEAVKRKNLSQYFASTTVVTDTDMIAKYKYIV